MTYAQLTWTKREGDAVAAAVERELMQSILRRTISLYLHMHKYVLYVSVYVRTYVLYVRCSYNGNDLIARRASKEISWAWTLEHTYCGKFDMQVVAVLLHSTIIHLPTNTPTNGKSFCTSISAHAITSASVFNSNGVNSLLKIHLSFTLPLLNRTFLNFCLFVFFVAFFVGQNWIKVHFFRSLCVFYSLFLKPLRSLRSFFSFHFDAIISSHSSFFLLIS